MRLLLLILPTALMLAGGAVRTADDTPHPGTPHPDTPHPGTAARRDNAAARAAAVIAYRLPLPGSARVVRGFDPPRMRYGAGHLGVDLATGEGSADEVLAAGPGRVSFAGSVAGRGVVVIAHPDGITTEYEPVRPSVRAGETVRSGQPIGVIDGAHRGCSGPCLHWGARRGDAYIDPMSLLRALGPVRLLPWNARDAPDP